MADYELSLLEGDNTIEILEGDNILTLGMLMPTASFLGVPPSGSFSDGQVDAWPSNTTVAKAIDDLNVALKDVANSADQDVTLGTPTDGSFADGYVESLATDMRPVDAIDLLNEGLLEVSQAADNPVPDTLAQATGGRDVTAGQVSTFTPSTITADAIVDINQALAGVAGALGMAQANLQDVASAIQDAQTDLADLSTLAHAPGQQPAGTPSGGWVPGYSTFTAQTGITDALNLLNQGLRETSTVATTMAEDLTLLHGEVDVLSTMAQSPGQQALGTPTGGWQAGYSPLGTATLLADSINILNQGLGTVAQTAASPGSQGAGTPAGGWSAGYTPLTASTPINGALNSFNAGLASVATIAAAPGQRAAGAPTGGWQAGQTNLTNATLLADGLNILNAGLLGVATTAASPGQRASGAPTGGWQAGQASLTNATLITDALNTLNVAIKTVADTPAAAAKLGPATDGSYADGLVTLDATMSVGDAVDNVNEGIKELTQGTRSFGNLALADTASLAWAQRAKLTSPSDGVLAATNNAGTLAGIYQAALFQAANADGAVQFGNSAKTNGLAIGADTLALKVANTNALAWTFGTVPQGTLNGTLILNRAGTAAAPSLGFSATDGLFAPAAGEIGISTGGTQRLRLNAAGLFGINADPISGTLINITAPSILNTEYTFSIINAAADRWLRWRNDGRLMVQPYMQCNNVVLGIWGNSAIGNTSGSYLDFSNNIATTPVSLVSAASMNVNPTFVVNARSSANTLDIMRWQQNGTTVVTMANGGALSGPGFYPNATQAAAGTVVYGDSGLLNGMGINTTNSSVVFRTNNTDALIIDSTQSQTIPAAAGLLWSGRGGIFSTADGVYQFKNVAGTAATLLFGPSTSSGARLALSATSTLTLQTGTGSTTSTVFNAATINATTIMSAKAARIADTSGANIQADSVIANATGTVNGASYTAQPTLNGGTLRAVLVKVTTALTGTGLTGFNIGDTGSTPIGGVATSATAFGSNIAIAAGTATTTASYTVTMPRAYAGTINIVITPVGAATMAGTVRISWVIDTFAGPNI